MMTECTVCGRPLTPMEQTLAASSAGHQCHRCWRRITAEAAKKSQPFSRGGKRPYAAGHGHKTTHRRAA